MWLLQDGIFVWAVLVSNASLAWLKEHDDQCCSGGVEPDILQDAAAAVALGSRARGADMESQAFWRV